MPRKVFVAGEILTAADVNTNLMDQSVMVFDDATARATAIPTPVEGMTTYLKDLDAVEFFDGSVFRRVGGLIAVKSAIFKGTQTAAVSGKGNLAVTDLSITHALSNSSHKLLISAFLGGAGSSQGFGNVGLAVDDGSGLIEIGDAGASGESRVTAGGRVAGSANGDIVTMPSVTFIHSPGDTSSRTYTVRAINIINDTRTIFINRSNSPPANDSMRAVSSIVIQEVAV